MIRIKDIALVILILIPTLVMSQDKRADKLYQAEDYKGALNSYLKAYDKEPTNDQLAEKIGLCYFELQDYLIASEYFKTAGEINPSNQKYKLAYVKALIYAMEIDQAETHLNTFLQQNPDSKEGQHLLETCSHIKSWGEIKNEYIVIPLININSSYDDFAPAVYKDNLVFTSTRIQDLKDFQGVDSQKNRKTNIYIAEFDNNEKTRFEKPRIFLSSLDESNNHGPISFTKFGKKAFFNSTGISAEKMGKKLTLKVFEMDNSLDEWSKPVEISINNSVYSIYHPFTNEEGDLLFYVSDRPGGYGGLDLYYSTKESGVWGTPKNLGPKINTAEDEVFPTYYNGVLYFSSNGIIGYGGLDIFEVDNFRLPKLVKNLGFPINSSSDDFNIIYRNKSDGYFVSDRPGGLGGDDLFAFNKKELNKERTTIKGELSFNKAAVNNARVDLLDQASNVLQTSITDEEGMFQFNAVGVHSVYEVKIDIEGSRISDDYYFNILNSRGERVVAIFPNENERLLFEALPLEEYNSLSPIDSKNSLLAVDLKGQIYKESRGDISEKITLYVLNPDEQVMARGYTDAKGNFEFKRLPPEDYYTLRPENPTPGIHVIILGDGDEVVVLRANEKRKEFLYTRLSPDETYITLLNEDGYPVKIKLRESFKIDNIYYDIDSYEINDAAKSELDKLAMIMLNNKNLEIRLLSHTDSRDSDKYNLELSQRRANTAKNHLIEKGVTSDMIIAVGMGESQLLNHCKNGVKCSEEEHAVNRRTVFEIIKN